MENNTRLTEEDKAFDTDYFVQSPFGKNIYFFFFFRITFYNEFSLLRDVALCWEVFAITSLFQMRDSPFVLKITIFIIAYTL